jgi:hypothetical protein
MTRAVLVGLAALSLGLACSEKGRSLVLVDLTADPNLGAVSAAVIVTQFGDPIGHADRTGSMPWKLGAYLDKHVTGSVDVVGCAFDPTGALLAVGTPASDVMIHAGEQSGPVPIMLVSGTSSPFCVGADGGSGGTGGGAGIGGTSGNDGGGTGGSAGGAGDGGGLGGTGGMAGGGGNAGGGVGGVAGTGGGGGSCDLSKPFGAPVLVPAINSTSDEYAIWLTRDGLSAVIASNRSGGPGDYDLYGTTRSATSRDFGAPTLLRNVNTADAETKPALSPNGLNLFFSSDRPRAGTGYDVYVASRPNLMADFGAPALVPAASSTVSDLLHSVTADGQYLYFDRPVTGTNRDIFVLNLTTGGTPTPVAELNSQYDDGHAILSDDLLTVYFASTRIGVSTSDGSAAANILTAHRSTATGTFTDLALVSELNTDSSEIPSYLSPDGCTLYIDSDRGGRLHLWVAVKP